MKYIINNLTIGEVLYTTKNGKGTDYKYLGLNKQNSGIKYSINDAFKVLPFFTIEVAMKLHKIGKKINANWYKDFNVKEYKSKPCNLKVLNSLLEKYQDNFK
jgi:hypothetical protein